MKPLGDGLVVYTYVLRRYLPKYVGTCSTDVEMLNLCSEIEAPR